MKSVGINKRAKKIEKKAVFTYCYLLPNNCNNIFSIPNQSYLAQNLITNLFYFESALSKCPKPLRIFTDLSWTVIPEYLLNASPDQ